MDCPQQPEAAENKAQAEQSSHPGKPKASESESVIPMSLIKALGRQTSSVGGGSSSSNGGGSGNNSDNSALVSIGNGSFGFNFDAEDAAMMNPSRASSDGDGSDGNGRQEGKIASKIPSEVGSISDVPEGRTERRKWDPRGAAEITGDSAQTNISHRSSAPSQGSSKGSNHDAAAAAVANLHSIASSYSASNQYSDEVTSSSTKPASSQQTLGSKRAAPASFMGDNDSGGYNSDDSADTNSMQSASTQDANTRPKKKKKKKLSAGKREERNMREKERSFKITKQINELRNLLASGGVTVPKGTKSSVLSEAASYIRMLQQHQYRSELDRHQLVQQMQMIGNGTLGPQAASAVRHVAAQNGVWSLGNFGGVPPKSAMTYYKGSTKEASQSEDSSVEAPLSATIAEHEYRYVFNSCAVGMAIASMGGAFIDCNQLFSQLANYTKQEICSMTIFNLTSRADLQQAFDLISQMISPPTDGGHGNQRPPCVLRGSMKNRNDLGLSVSLIRDSDRVAKCFCVTLIKNPSSPFDTSKPVPATANLIMADSTSDAKRSPGDLNTSPAYTTG